MKKLIVMCLILFATSAFADGLLPRDLNRNIIQGAAPAYNLQQVLTVVSTTIDMSGSLWWAIYPPSVGCKYRLMPTSAKAAYPQFTAPDGVSTGQIVNSTTKFIDYSGCTLGELSRQ